MLNYQRVSNQPMGKGWKRTSMQQDDVIMTGLPVHGVHLFVEFLPNLKEAIASAANIANS